MAESHPVDVPSQEHETQIESESENEDQIQDQQADAAEGSSKPKKKKKKSKKSKIVNALTGKQEDKSSEPAEGSSSRSAPKLDEATIKTLLDVNPALKGSWPVYRPIKHRRS